MATEELLVRNMSFSVKATPGSTGGDITVQDMNVIMNTFMQQGYKIISAHAYHSDQDSFRVYVCMAKQ